MNYFLLLQSRPLLHLTSIAVKEISVLKSSNLHKKWFLPILEKLSKSDLLFFNGEIGNEEYFSFYQQHKNSFKYRLRESCDKEWSYELCNSVKLDMHKNFDVHDNVFNDQTDSLPINNDFL